MKLATYKMLLTTEGDALPSKPLDLMFFFFYHKGARTAKKLLYLFNIEWSPVQCPQSFG